MKEDDKFRFETAEIKLKEIFNFLLCLQLEGAITNDTYSYMDEQLMYVLKEIIQPVLYPYEN